MIKKRFIAVLLAFQMMLSCAPVFAWSEYYGDATVQDDSNLENEMESIYKYDVGDFANSGNTAEKADSAEIVLVTKLGLMNIGEDGLFRPNDILTEAELKTALSKFPLQKASYGNDNEKVKVREAARKLICALLYDNWGDTLNDTDGSLLMKVKSIKLFDGLDLELDKNITRGEFAHMLLNALNADFIQYKSDINTLYEKTDESVMEALFDVHKIEGVLNGVEELNLYGGKAPSRGYVEIDGSEYEDGGLNLRGLFGRRVLAYAHEDDGAYTIITVSEYGNSMTLNLNKLNKIEGTKIWYYDDNNAKKSVSVSKNPVISYNGDVKSDLSDLSELAELAGVHGTITFSSSQRSGTYDIVVVRRFSDFVIDSVLTNKGEIRFAYGASLNGKETISADKDTSGYTYIELNEEEVDINSLNTGMTVSIIANSDGSVVEIYANSSAISGDVKSVDEDEIIIDDVNYIIADKYLERSAADPSSVKQIKTGSRGKFYLTFDGYIAGFKEGTAETAGVLVKAFLSDAGDEALIKVFNEYGKMETLKFVDKPTVDGVTMDAATAFSTLKDYANRSYTKSYNDWIYGDYTINVLPLVFYKSGSKGVTVIKTAMGSEDLECNGAYAIDKKDRFDWMGLSSLVTFRNSWPQESEHRGNSNTVAFLIPSDKDKDDEYKVTNGGDSIFKQGSVDMVQFFCEDDYNVAEYVVRESGSTVVDDSASNTVSTLFYVKSLGEMYNETQEEIVPVLYGTAIAHNTDAGTVTAGVRYQISQKLSEAMEFKTGCIYNIRMANNEIYSAAKFYDPEDKSTMFRRYVGSDANYNSYLIGTFKMADPQNNTMTVSTVTESKLEVDLSMFTRSNTSVLHDENGFLTEIGVGALEAGDRVWVAYTRGHATCVVVID